MPDETPPHAAWLWMALPPRRFQFGWADVAFPPERVHGPRADVMRTAFGRLEAWGYSNIGPFIDRSIDTEAIAFSSSELTIWVILFGKALTVAITPLSETDPTRLKFHLDEVRRRRWKFATWGAFPLGPANLPAAARAFLDAAEPVLAQGGNDYEAIREHLGRAAKTVMDRKLASWLAAKEYAEAGKHRAAVRILEYWEHELSDEQRVLLDSERTLARSEAQPIERGRLSEAEWISARAEYMTQVHRHLHDAFAKRDVSNEDRKAWSMLATEFGEARRLLYDDLEQTLAVAKKGDSGATDRLVTFLEADPWCFRSGYFKGRAYEALRQIKLDEAQTQRARRILLIAVQAGPRTEFRSACRLARIVADAELIGELRQLMASGRDGDVRRHALWMLTYIPNALTDDDRASILDVLVDSASYSERWGASGWIHRTSRTWAGDEFDARVRELIRSEDPEVKRRGIRLLPHAIRIPLDAGERHQLEPIVLEAAHDRGPGAGLVESLAALADTKRLRGRLAELATTAGYPTKRYARWALNAARLANGEEAPDL